MNSSYQLNGVLSKLGMPSLFKAGANLTAMTDDANLFLDEVYHRTMISNDEAGSDAGNPYTVSLPPLQAEILSNPALFTANHPFLFAIIDVDAKTVLFMGRVNHP
jgi:serpin B